MAQQCPHTRSNGGQSGNAQQHIYVTPTTAPTQQPVYVTSPQPSYTTSPQPNPYAQVQQALYANHSQQRQHQPTVHSAKYVGTSSSDVSNNSYDKYSSDIVSLDSSHLN